MTDISFDRLRDVALRDAWKHESLAFTPWLASNIDHIAEAIGIPLELTGTEVAVGGFSADLLARNPQDDTVVLIENQLEQTDHTHLGQIMTYLAGLEAKTVVWIAPTFREPHLSAIRWLNEHTAEGFAFFALRLRVVRIGDSPFAPIFEVEEKPSNWDRRLTEARRQATGDITDLGQKRLDFWTTYVERHPEDTALGITAGGASSVGATVGTHGIRLVLWVGRTKVGVFVRGDRGTPAEEVIRLLSPYADALQSALGARFGTAGNSLLGRDLRIDTDDPANWPKAIDWLHATSREYLSVLTNTLGANP